MGKKHRHKSRPVTIEDPVCPTCGRRDKLYEDKDLSEMAMTGCERCNVQFWFEEIEQDEEGDDGDTAMPWDKPGKSAAASASVFAAAKAEDGRRSAREAHPVLGTMVELTHAV